VSWPSLPALVLGLAAAAVVAAVAGGVWVMGSPFEQRLRRLDAQRVDDLASIADAVEVYWKRHERLPASLGDLAGESGIRFASADPEGGTPYEYRPGEQDAYSVCATFARDSDAGAGRTRRLARSGEWNHTAGRQCFERRAN
jgi:hypothetical protein